MVGIKLFLMKLFGSGSVLQIRSEPFGKRFSKFMKNTQLLLQMRLNYTRLRL